MKTIYLIAAIFVTQVPLPRPFIAYEITTQPERICGADRDVCIVREPERCVIVQHPYSDEAKIEAARLRCLSQLTAVMT